ncbi:MAG TPA: monooxygenase, partial [Aliiroseovarius sp.]|nr:monooxygenase [Aliiroseovarius sp.]
ADITFADGQVERTSFLVGADGLHSVLRPVLNMPAKPFFTGQVAWRAILPAFGQAAPEARVFMGPGRHLVVYPLRGGELLNIVAVEERDAWAEEGWFHADDPENLRRSFKAFCPEVQAILERVTDVYLWGLHRHPVAMEWHRGRAALLGDAAHPTLPFMAQGAVMALEDAWILAASLAALGLDDGPALYQARRRHRAERVIEAANKNARNYHHANPLVRAAGFGAMRLINSLAPTRLFQRFDWIYGFDVTREG